MADELIAEPVVSAESTTAVDTAVDQHEAVAGEAVVADTEPQSDLEAYLADQLKDEPEEQAEVAETAPVVPEAFAQALKISEFVQAPEHVEAAVRAADEIWKVTSGQAPVSGLLEGMRSGNEQGFVKIVNDLIPYLEQVTGQKFGTGDAAPVDPFAQFRAEMAAEKQAVAEQQAQTAYQQSVAKAIPVLQQTISETLGKTFGPGHEQYFINQVAAASKISEKDMIAALNRGDKAPLEAAIQAVKSAELRRFKAVNDFMVKQSKNFRKALPISKGGSVALSGDSKFDMTTREGRIAHGTAVMNGEIDL